jgi:hypothetical protein
MGRQSTTKDLAARLQATFGYSKELKDELERLPFRSGTETMTGRALLARAPVQILDSQTDRLFSSFAMPLLDHSNHCRRHGATLCLPSAIAWTVRSISTGWILAARAFSIALPISLRISFNV